MNQILIIIGFLLVGIGASNMLKFKCPFHQAGERSAHAVINNPKDGDYFVVKIVEKSSLQNKETE